MGGKKGEPAEEDGANSFISNHLKKMPGDTDAGNPPSRPRHIGLLPYGNAYRSFQRTALGAIPVSRRKCRAR
jgi:hypothetical protein